MGPQKVGPHLASSPPPSRRASQGWRKGRGRAGTGLLEASGSGTSHTDGLVTQHPPLSSDPVEQPLPHLDTHKCSLKQLDAGWRKDGHTAAQVSLSTEVLHPRGPSDRTGSTSMPNTLMRGREPRGEGQNYGSAADELASTSSHTSL